MGYYSGYQRDGRFHFWNCGDFWHSLICDMMGLCSVNCDTFIVQWTVNDFIWVLNNCCFMATDCGLYCQIGCEGYRKSDRQLQSFDNQFHSYSKRDLELERWNSHWLKRRSGLLVCPEGKRKKQQKCSKFHLPIYHHQCQVNAHWVFSSFFPDRQKSESNHSRGQKLISWWKTV